MLCRPSRQDWQCTAVALTIRNRPIMVTLHNVYDSGGVSPALLADFGIDPSLCPGPIGSSAPTLLQRALPLTVGPLRAVSEGFARAAVEEPLQAQVLAEHLQAIFRARGVVGVDNGPFKAMAPGLLQHLIPANPAALLDWKRAHRHEALEALRSFEPSPTNPVWGGLTINQIVTRSSRRAVAPSSKSSAGTRN
jgi:hypothetical protein